LQLLSLDRGEFERKDRVEEGSLEIMTDKKNGRKSYYETFPQVAELIKEYLSLNADTQPRAGKLTRGVFWSRFLTTSSFTSSLDLVIESYCIMLEVIM